MNKTYIAVGTAVLFLLLLYPKFPGIVSGMLGFVLLILLVNKWDNLKGFFA